MFDQMATFLVSEQKRLRQNWLVAMTLAIVAGGTGWISARLFDGQQIASQQAATAAAQSRASLLETQRDNALKAAGSLAANEGWRLSEDQKRRLVANLAAVHSKPIVMRSVGESRRMASDVAAAVREAGLTVIAVQETPTMTDPLGITLETPDLDNPPEPYAAIKSAFDLAQIAVRPNSLVYSHGPTVSPVIIVVGPEPW